MNLSTLLVTLHQALNHMGLNEQDSHFVLDWIKKDVEDLQGQQRITNAAMLLLGFVVGIIVGNYLCLM